MFLSHCKADAEGTARAIKDDLETELGQSIFLDWDSLHSLFELQDHVRASQAAVLLQTRNVLKRLHS